MSISPHASETLVHRHVLLQDLLRCALASVVLAGHEGWLDLRKGRKLLYGFGRQRRAKEQLRMEMCLRPKHTAGIWRHEAKRRTPPDVQKATAVNRRRSATSSMPKRIRRWVIKGIILRDSLNEGRVFKLNWIKIRSLGSAISNRLFSRNKKCN